MIDFTKPVQTRDGRPVEIITTKGRSHQPVLGYIEDNVLADYWSAGGEYIGAGTVSEVDLINVPEPVVWWVNVYPERCGAVVQHASLAPAQKFARGDRLALLKLAYTKGNATVEIIEEKE
jgi:hypothetical protein